MSEDPKKAAISAESGAVPTKREMRQEIRELAKMVLVFLIQFWALKVYVIEGYEVQGPSMSPTLQDHERILVLKLPHNLSKLALFSWVDGIEAGDIIVFKSDEEVNKRYIKRVVAEGPKPDRGQVVDADPRDAAPEEGVQVEMRKGHVFVDDEAVEDAYLVPEERDSRDSFRQRVGAGEYFVLGDHRSISKDSRSFGPVNENQIVGKAFLRFWPLNKFGLL